MQYLNALNSIDGIGSRKLEMLVAHFSNAEKAWNANLQELIQSGIGEKLSEKFVEQRKNINPDLEWKKLQDEEIFILSINDTRYPKLLREIHNPPYLIYAKGNLSLLNSTMIAVVGSRKFTEYGKRVAHAFGRDLAHAGITIVSGLALGIDAIAHESALEIKGKTIAVLGNGLDQKSIHPKTNLQLCQEIIRNDGLIISECPIGTPPTIGSFPARNRIMAGISLGTIVIEAAIGSGTLITANLALEFNREIFAVPGPIFYPQYEGNHKLIKTGAKIACAVSDILEEINFNSTSVKEEKVDYMPTSKEEEKILHILNHEPSHIDTIRKMTKLETSIIGSTLAILEINGIVKNVGGQNYVRL